MRRNRPQGPRPWWSATWFVVAVVGALLVGPDLLYHKHGHFGWEEWFGFHAFFGFAAFVFIVLAGKHLRKLLMRDEDYYDR